MFDRLQCLLLVIDDEVQISTLMCDVLEQQGARIDLANSGKQAVERMKSNQYDLYICDHRMPDVSGAGLYRSIESTNPEARYRFLFVTGEADPRAVHDREIVRHRIVEPDEAVVEDVDRVVGYHFWSDRHGGESSGAVCRHLRLVLSDLAARFLPGRDEARGLPPPLQRALPDGRAERAVLFVADG